MKGFTLGLALKQRRKATRTSPIIQQLVFVLLHSESNLKQLAALEINDGLQARHILGKHL